MEVKKDILWRVYLCFIGVVFISVVILGKAVVIQRLQGDHWRSMGDSMQLKIAEINAERGTIFSEDGQMLSTSLPQFDIYMDTKADGLRAKDGMVYKRYIDSFAVAMSGYFGDKSAAEYRKALDEAYNKGVRYFPLLKKISFEDYKAFREFPLVRLGRNKSGIIVEQSSKRIAPFGLLANRTIGLSREYVNSDGKVKKMNVGLEMSYDSLLTGQNGKRLVRYISGGAVPVEGAQVEPENGRDIYTTIDVNMQDIVENALLKILAANDAVYGTCILMETRTGKIKAMANLGKVGDSAYWENDNYALRVTEPGSTIKMVTYLSVLEKGVFKVNDLVEVGSAGHMQVGPRMVTDAERSPKPVLTVAECLAHSSNVGLAKMANKAFAANPAEFGEWMHRFHMDKKSPIDLAHIPNPRLAPLAKDNGGLMNMLTMSFGYAVQVSPLQTLTLYNAVANHGRMMKPYLVNSIWNNGVMVRQIEPTVMEEHICSEHSIKAAQQGLELAITEGTGRPAFKNMPFKVAGKTGTAHVADGNIKYSDRVFQASFVGYFPADNPQYSCIVVVRTKPHAFIHYGGQLGAPVFREVATKIYSMFVDRKTPKGYEGSVDSSSYFYAGNTESIKSVYRWLQMPFVDSIRNMPWASVYAKNFKPVIKENRVRENVMPNVKGMGLRDAINLLEKMGMNVLVNGSGKIAEQSIEPGTPFRKGQKVLLKLS
ncbi:MAG: penicillin-binding protein [Niabella sp.]